MPRKFAKFAVAGHAINVAALPLPIGRFSRNAPVLGRSVPITVIPQGIGILRGMAPNFAFSALVVLKKRSEEGADRPQQEEQRDEDGA